MTILNFMTTFHNFDLRIETGWATRVVKPILKIRNVMLKPYETCLIRCKQITITWRTNEQ